MQIESNNLPPEFEHVLNGSLLFEIYLSASDLTYNCTKNYTVEKTKIFFSFPRPIARNCGKHIFSSRHSSMQYESFGGWGHRSPWLPHAQSLETVENTSFHQNNCDAICIIWRMGASIPLPLACKASALPFELIPHVHMLGIKSSVLLRSTKPAREETNEESQMKL